MKKRLFIALPLPGNIKEEITRIKLPDNFKRTRQENLHITILFLGDVEEAKIPEIISILEQVKSNHTEFELDISYTGQFPEKGYPRIIYISGKTNFNKLKSLADDVRNNAALLNFKDDKDFKYHITIGRQKYKTNEFIKIPVLNKTFNFTIDKLVLYKSDLQKSGPEYTPLWHGLLKDS